MALALAGCVNAQADSTSTSWRYQGQPIDAITSVGRAPVSESRSRNDRVYIFTEDAASTAMSTGPTMGFIRNTQVSATTTSWMPTTIDSRGQVFTDTNNGANGACSSMFQQPSHQ